MCEGGGGAWVVADRGEGGVGSWCGYFGVRPGRLYQGVACISCAAAVMPGDAMYSIIVSLCFLRCAV